ncbi:MULTISPECIES: hypothetical protein [unclassified Mycolicibacterium]|uniref:hypothetical protein n=1 Tax=unclassified Mycolicibacterium TaxID=2636767 RepID=UPI0013FDD3E2
MSLQERLLPLGGERDVEGPARAGQPHHEHPAFDQHAADVGPELSEIHFRFRTGQMILWNRDLDPVQAQLDSSFGDVS